LAEVPDDIPLEDILDLPGLCADAQDDLAQCLNDPSPRNCQGVPAAILETVCASVNVPLPVLCPTGGGGNGGGGLPNLPGVPNLPGNLPDLPGNLGGNGGGNGGGLGGGLGGLLNRPGTSTTAGAGGTGQGPTYGELMQMFDPGLTSLLTPGMVLR